MIEIAFKKHDKDDLGPSLKKPLEHNEQVDTSVIEIAFREHDKDDWIVFQEKPGPSPKQLLENKQQLGVCTLYWIVNYPIYLMSTKVGRVLVNYR